MKGFPLTVFLLCLLIMSVSCDEKLESKASAKAKQKPAFFAQFDAQAEETAVIYEANIRQYSPEGSFNAFTQDIPVLKELGVKVIWLMPIFPISETKRKGGLGSYYAVSDFREVNPEFGSLEDVDALIKVAHENDIAVILDWVPNHTGWDHTWISQHPDWYTQNEKGEIVDPQNPDTGASFGWTDVADLNFDNPQMRVQMIRDLKYWVEKHDVDGFRMDVAHKVPVDFFKTAIDSLEKIKPLFMLAEAEQVNLMANGYDMHYAWEMHHLLNEVAKEEKTAMNIKEKLVEYEAKLGKDDINMYFVTNHDENSWAGTLSERMPENKEIFTALTYMMPGMPLIYSGQEYDLNHRLAFFEKDSIPKQRGDYFELLKKLGHLKNSEPSLNGGKVAATLKFVETGDETVLAFRRSKGGQSTVFIGNFSNSSKEVSTSLEGVFKDLLDVEQVYNSKDALGLAAWEFRIFQEVSND